MGGLMAADLVKAGFKVKAFDLSKQAQMAASKAGVSLAESAAEADQAAGTLITIHPPGKRAISVWAEVMPQVAKCALVINSSTIDMTSARRAHELASEQGCCLRSTRRFQEVSAERAPAGGLYRPHPPTMALSRGFAAALMPNSRRTQRFKKRRRPSVLRQPSSIPCSTSLGTAVTISPDSSIFCAKSNKGALSAVSQL